MHQPLFVGVLEAECRLADVGTSFLDRKRPALGDEQGQVHSLDELHHQEMAAVDLLCVITGDDMGVVETGRSLHLAAEPVHCSGLADQARMDDLQGDKPVHQPVPRLEHGAHAATAKVLQDLITRMVGQ